jgi:hypothetical protein
MMKATGLDPEHKLIGDLMKNYDQNARPILDKTKPVNVRFDLAVNQIVELVNILSYPFQSVGKLSWVETSLNTPLTFLL